MQITLKNYLTLSRLHRPAGTFLLLFPALWGLALGSSSFPPLSLIFLFGCGAFLMRSAGCVYNDVIDRDFDVKVRRTAPRPLATEEISVKSALLFFGILLVASAGILFHLPGTVIFTGFMALGLVLTYPWMKRITYWPQLFLGLTFNIGILMGWLSVNKNLSLIPFLFYGGAILWTLGYDTIYALQDAEDDLFAGVKSTTLIVSSFLKLFLSLVYFGAVVSWGIGGALLGLTWTFWIFLSLISFQFLWQIVTLKDKDGKNCRKRFESNISIGGLLFLGIVFSRFIA